jgi:hypothetical protein
MSRKKAMPNTYDRTVKSVRRVIDAIDNVDRSFEALARKWYELPQEMRDANPSLAAWFELQRQNPDRTSPNPEHMMH